MSSSDEAVMAIVCAKADPFAFAELVRRWDGRIRALCLRLTGSREDAEDATQEAFSRAFAARSQFRGGSKFSTWLWRIAINCSLDICRQYKAPVPPTAEFDDQNDPAVLIAHAEEKDSVRRALRQLGENHRTVLILRHYEQLRFREIAEVLDIPEGTVASRMAEALNQVRKLLERNNHD